MSVLVTIDQMRIYFVDWMDFNKRKSAEKYLHLYGRVTNISRLVQFVLGGN
jgi:dimeric dUTPase (all-alpha-NTP-PPase superfamily)